MNTTPDLPLTGIRVIDLSRALAGPHCTALLADLGADVIKVESSRGGDPSRAWPPFDGEHSLYYESINRNKRSVAVDLYSAEGIAVLDALIAGGDALVENFKPGTLAKMGYTEERLRELNPELVLASVSGYGDRGPLRDRPGLDQVIQAVSGISSVTGPVGSSGYRVGLSIVDLTSGMTAAIGLLGALLGRARGRSVSRVSTSLYETALSLSVFQGQGAITNGVAPAPQGNDHPTITPYGVYQTSTDPIVVAVTTEAHWRALCVSIDAEELLTDARFGSGRERTASRAELNRIVNERLATADAESWIELLNGVGIPCGAILDYAQVMAHPHTAALELVRETERADGSALRLLRGPLSVDGLAAAIRRPPPALGQHSAEVLAELGYGAADRAALFAAGGVLGVPEANR